MCLLAAACISAQDCKHYYYLQGNKTIEMTIYNKKGNPDGSRLMCNSFLQEYIT